MFKIKRVHTILFAFFGTAAAYDYYNCGTTAAAWGVLAIMAFGGWMESTIKESLKK